MHPKVWEHWCLNLSKTALQSTWPELVDRFQGSRSERYVYLSKLFSKRSTRQSCYVVDIDVDVVDVAVDVVDVDVEDVDVDVRFCR